MKSKECKERYEKAFAILESNIGFDYIIESYVSPDFVEFITSNGGDIIRLRVMDDGTIYER